MQAKWSVKEQSLSSFSRQFSQQTIKEAVYKGLTSNNGQIMPLLDEKEDHLILSIVSQ